MIRAEVSDTNAEELKERFSLNRFIIVLIELEGSTDLLMRIFLGICLAKNNKIAKDELKILTAGIKGVKSVTFNEILSMQQKTLHLDEKDIVR